MSEFGIRARAIMNEKKLSQKELSKLSGVSEPSLCRYLRGDSEPRLDIIQNVARALGVSEAYLFGKTDANVVSDEIEEIKRIVARNRNVLTRRDKSDILALLYGEDDD